MKQILIVSTADTPQSKQIVTDFVANLNQRSQDIYNCVDIHYDDIGFEFGDRIRVFSLVSGADIASYDFVYFKSYIHYEEQSLALAVILKQHSIPFVCSEVEYGYSSSKLSQYALLAVGGLPLPKTLFIPSKRLPQSYDTFASALGIPFVLKATDGARGEANYLIRNRDEFTNAIAQHAGVEFVGQSFIANSGDLRVLIINGAIRLVIGRARKDDSTHLNNTSQGANARLVDVGELSEEAKALSLKASQTLRREIAGVDIMFEKDTNKPYILEVNASPQVGSGAFIEEKLSVYHDFFVEVLQNN